MGSLTCSICKKKKSKISFLNWYRCTRHGVICRSCKAGGLITEDKCPKCGKKLIIINT